MRLFSYFLIAIGILMIAMNGLEQQDERPENNKGAGAFEVESRKAGDHTFWPSLAGGIILVSGIVMVVRRRKRSV